VRLIGPRYSKICGSINGSNAQLRHLRLELLEEAGESVLLIPTVGVPSPVIGDDFGDGLDDDPGHFKATHRLGVEHHAIGEAREAKLLDGVAGPVPVEREAVPGAQGDSRALGGTTVRLGQNCVV
jgi:hypothetical protein